MHGMHLMVLNGMHLFPRTHGYTCHTANDGQCVVDYALVHRNAMQYVSKFDVGKRIPESHHIQLHICLDFALDRPSQAQAAHGPQRMAKNHKALYKERAA